MGSHLQELNAGLPQRKKETIYINTVRDQLYGRRKSQTNNREGSLLLMLIHVGKNECMVDHFHQLFRTSSHCLGGFPAALKEKASPILFQRK